MTQAYVLLDAFTRVHDSLHRTLADLSATELTQEPQSADRLARLAS